MHTIIFMTLQDINSNELRINETELNHFTFDQLKSNTSYELKVFIQTHVGYNVNHSLITNFTTKTKSESSHNSHHNK